jgi:hypothetical protein
MWWSILCPGVRFVHKCLEKYQSEDSLGGSEGAEHEGLFSEDHVAVCKFFSKKLFVNS